MRVPIRFNGDIDAVPLQSKIFRLHGFIFPACFWIANPVFRYLVRWVKRALARYSTLCRPPTLRHSAMSQPTGFQLPERHSVLRKHTGHYPQGYSHAVRLPIRLQPLMDDKVCPLAGSCRIMHGASQLHGQVVVDQIGVSVRSLLVTDSA